jgi:serine protease Do
MRPGPLLALVTAVALLLAAPALRAATPEPAYQQMIDALTRAHEAVVGVNVTAAAGARSSETLGKERAGSGVVIGADGLVLTIGYLILEADSIQLVTQEGRTVPARPVAYDLATGFGLVRAVLPLRGITPVRFGSSDELATGQAVMAAIGGVDGDVSMTHLVSKRAFSGYWEYHIESALFTSPPIGNHSGAPLFNQRGELLGIGSLLVNDALGDNRRLPGNMFVPVELLRPILAEMQQTGTSRLSRRPWLGLSSAVNGGQIQIVRVNKDSPAQSAGLQPGDLVLAIGGEQVSTLEQFYKRLWSHPKPDDEIQLTVKSGADVRNVTIKPVDRQSTLVRPSGI